MVINDNNSARQGSEVTLDTGVHGVQERTVLEKLKQSEQNFRYSLDYSPLAHRIMKPSGELAYVNKAFLETWGFCNLEEFQRTPGEQRYTPESYAYVMGRKEKARRGEAIPNEYEADIVRKDGEIRHLKVWAKEVLWNGETFHHLIHQDITEHRCAERALQESEEKYRSLVENAGEGIVIGQDNVVKLVNSRMVEITGFSKEELAGRPFLEFIHPEDRSMIADRYARRLRGEDVPRSYPFRLVNRAGNPRWLQVSSAQILWNNRPATLNFFTDITESKRSEDKLKESEERYSSLVEKGNDGIIIICGGLLDFANSRMCQMTGFAPDEALGKPFIWFVAPEYREFVMNIYKKRISGEQVPARYEIAILSKDGKEIPVEVSASIIQQSAKTMDMAILRDITARKHAEQALRESEEKYRTLVENASDLIYLIGEHDEVLSVNKAGASFLERGPAEVVGKSIFDLFPAEIAKGYSKNLRKVFMTGEALHVESVMVAGGKEFFMTISLTPVTDETGRVSSVLSASRDITEQKRSIELVRNLQMDIRERDMQLEIERLKEEKARSEKMAIVGQMASMIAHEMRNPLGIINNSLYYLKMRPEMSDEKIQRHIAAANKAVSSASTIVEDLLDYAKPKTPVLQPVLIDHIIEEALSRLPVKDNINVIREFAHDMPPVQADIEILQRVFINLIQNAQQAMPNGGMLKLKTIIREGWQEASVIDNGEGIPGEMQERVFDPLFSTRIKGIGLGLYIAKQIVTQHGGNIRVTSEPGKGSTFTVRLPS